ncbi:putative CUB and sushi domain-containing protein 2 [Apostichopus japonicus]|uniref:Putative CUB and sushi domain-containing protein 2 n=1 Tax=Stichopus japonicus TaxID=307972 RepID=A0A2G8JZR2_STIJA|nr:putative CUB and sushi domain-containing protein 2 [Apostichopus japonicus]
MKRQIEGVPSLADFEIRKASLNAIADILEIKFCNDDHLAGVVCPGEEESDDPICASWSEVCNGRQFCGADEYDECLQKTIDDYGVPWFDFCRGEEKVDYCRLKDFQPTNFRTEKNYDYLNIGKGLDYLTTDVSQLILNKFSGDVPPEPAEFQTPNNEIFIAFISDAYDNEQGFKIGVKVADEDDTSEVYEPPEPVINKTCGEPEVMELDEGSKVVITSPNFPDTYSPNSQCDWQFKGAPGRRVGIKVVRLDTENKADVVTVGHGESVGSRDNIVARLEGNDIPRKPVVVDSEDVWIRFTTDTAMERTGFKFEVSEIPAVGCGGDFKVPEDGSIVIASPNFPDLAYRVNQNCEWRFQSAPGRKLTMQFLEFKTQRYADVVSAGFGDEPAFDWSNYVITEHSGDALPDPPAFDSRKPSAWLSFRSDSFIVDRGFKVLVGDTSVYASGTKATKGEVHELNSDCGEEFSREDAVSEIVISSPKVRGYYTNLLDCIWVVNIPFGGHVKVQWDSFYTEPNRDFFTLGNGSDPNLESSVVIDKFSGLRPHRELDDTFQSLWIRFQTDLKNTYRGWQLRILPMPYTACGGLLNVPEGGSLAIASPGYPNDYPNSIVCRYTIQSTSGTRLAFTITQFDTSYQDYLTVGEGCSPEDGGDIILDKQAVTRPINYQFIPRTAAVWMKFSTDDYRTRPGWMINLADTGDSIEGQRGFGSCEEYTSDPTTQPPPEPTEAVEVIEEESEPEVVDKDEEETVEFPDWYDELEDEEEEARSSTMTPMESTDAPLIFEPEEGSGSVVQ